MFEGLLRLKQGATLSLDVLITDDNGQPVAWAAGQVTAQICDLYGSLVANPTVNIAANQGWGTIVADTSTWPVGRLAGQLTLDADGVISISDSFPLTIERPVSA